MGIKLGEEVEFFKLVKIDKNTKIDTSTSLNEVAVRLKNSEFSMKNIEDIINQKEKLQERIGDLTQHIKTISEDYNEPKNNDNSSQNLNKVKDKITGLEEENKKLKKMLREQMKKTENLRNETHIVVEKLREEFDSLVREFSNYK